MYRYIAALTLVAVCSCSKDSSDSSSKTKTRGSKEISRPTPKKCNPAKYKKEAWNDCWFGITVHVPRKVLGVPPLVNGRPNPEWKRMENTGVLVRTKGGQYSTPNDVDSGKAKADLSAVQMIRLKRNVYRFKVQIPTRVTKSSGEVWHEGIYVCYFDHDCDNVDPYKPLRRIAIRKKEGFKGKDGFPK